MKWLAVLSIFALLAVGQGRQLLESKPEGPEHPKYKVVNSTDALELRQYANATWAVAFGRSRWSTDLAAFYAGKALLTYFGGANVDHTKIKPTIPLIATILPPPPPPHKPGNRSHPHPPHPPHKNDTHNGTHPHPPHPPHPHPPHHPPGPPAVALAGYIPSKFEGDAPIPDCPHVKILHTNKTDVYVHKFGGWAINFVVKHEIRHTALALKALGICPFRGKFLVATYQGPFQIFGRRNEVLWVKKPKHHHHNETQDFDVQPVDLGALDVELLFPEEFPAKEEFPAVEGTVPETGDSEAPSFESKVEASEAKTTAASTTAAKTATQSASVGAVQVS